MQKEKELQEKIKYHEEALDVLRAQQKNLQIISKWCLGLGRFGFPLIVERGQTSCTACGTVDICLTFDYTNGSYKAITMCQGCIGTCFEAKPLSEKEG